MEYMGWTALVPVGAVLIRRFDGIQLAISYVLLRLRLNGDSIIFPLSPGSAS